MKKIAVIGGGTGNFSLLKGLKNYPIDLHAIVSMADSGGSTGVLRDEMGVLPPGDLRQCIVALSEESETLRSLMNYRYGEDSGKFSGQSFGNLFISTLEKVTGNLESALSEIHKLMKLKGDVVPVTYDQITLRARTANGVIYQGEHLIDEVLHDDQIAEVFYDPMPTANPTAIRSILEADVVVIAPGDPNTSILPNLIIPEIAVALKKTEAKVVMVCNLMTKIGHSNDFSVYGFVDRYEKAIGQAFIDCVIYNTQTPAASSLERYRNDGGLVIFVPDEFSLRPEIKLIGSDLVMAPHPSALNESSVKNLIRHNSTKLASLIYDQI
jgi:uncharacterized cofD-like protein